MSSFTKSSKAIVKIFYVFSFLDLLQKLDFGQKDYFGPQNITIISVFFFFFFVLFVLFIYFFWTISLKFKKKKNWEFVSKKNQTNNKTVNQKKPTTTTDLFFIYLFVRIRLSTEKQ